MSEHMTALWAQHIIHAHCAAAAAAIAKTLDSVIRDGVSRSSGHTGLQIEKQSSELQLFITQVTQN